MLELVEPTLPREERGGRRALPRRRADQVLELRLGERLAEELEFYGVAQNSRHVGHLVGLQGFLRIELLDGVANQIGRPVDLLGVKLDLLRIAPTPINALPINRVS